jgi:hypothetical protein
LPFRRILWIPSFRLFVSSRSPSAANVSRHTMTAASRKISRISPQYGSPIFPVSL